MYNNNSNKHLKPHYIRSNIKIGMMVDVVEKQNQKNGTLTRGRVRRILTSKPIHTQGIKVMLETGIVGRVQRIIR